MLDDMINGLLAGLPAWNRFLQPIFVMVVISLVPNFPILVVIGQILTFKIATELTLKNYTKESRMFRNLVEAQQDESDL